MSDLERQLERYLHEVLGIDVQTAPWEDARRLPPFLLERYGLAWADVLGRRLLLLIDEQAEQETPATIRKHIAQVEGRCDWPVVYVRDRVSAYNRKRLIEQRVPFVVPGNQMYLPELALDLRERFRSPTHSSKQFRPATQAVLIHSLLRRESEPLTAAGLAPTLGYSAMTIGRAFDELESAELAVAESIGRERILSIRQPRRETWERAQPWLVDPVHARHFVSAHEPAKTALRAGQSALARLSMISEPRNTVVAVSQKRWSVMKAEFQLALLPAREEHAVEVEAWKYEPRQYQAPGVVEPLSLFLSLRGSSDERVEQALSQMLEQLPW